MAFKGTRDTVITFYGVLKAIAEYERSLTDWDAPFDKYLREKNYPIKNEIKNGYNIFMGKALCGSCHFLPLLHGLVPPFYTEQEFEVIGVPEKPNSLVIDKDSGRYRITKKDIHLFSFKTTGLRNLAYTKPYMHHGKYKSLEEVIDFYINGGSSGFKEPLPNQTLPFDSLQLTKIEKKQLIQFLKSLNSPSISEKFQAPKKLPQLSDTKLNKRTIGGDY
jgi:cytochrome c peroxidase